MVAGVVSDKIRVSLLEPGVANTETIGYGEFQNSLTFSVTYTAAAPTMGIIAHTSGSADMTVPITNWDEYSSGWEFGNGYISEMYVGVIIFQYPKHLQYKMHH